MRKKNSVQNEKFRYTSLFNIPCSIFIILFLNSIMTFSKKKHLLFSFLMAFFAGGTVVFFSVLANFGFNDNFIYHWTKGFCLAYTILVPFIFFIAPKVQQMVERIIKKTE